MPPAPSSSRNVPGIVAFALAAVYVVVQIAQIGVGVALPALMIPTGASAAEVGSVLVVMSVGQLLLAATVTVLAAVAVARRNAPRMLAAIALGVGASGVVVGIASLILPSLIGAVLYR